MTEYIKAKEYLKAQCEKRKDSLELEMPQNYITDVEQANCDLAIEGRDVEIKGLKDRLAEEVELHLHAEEYIKSLEQQIEKMKTELDNARESANRQEQWEIYSVLNDLYNDNFEITKGVSN